MIWVKRHTFFALLLALFALLSQAFAQSSITVYVCGPDGRAIPGARVAILQNGREAASASTGENGEAPFATLPPAHYEISVSKDGFDALREEVADSAQPIRVTLAPAAQHESV